MTIDKNVVWSTVVGLVLGGIVLFGLWSLFVTVRNDHRDIQTIANVLNQMIKANQPAQTPAPTK